MGACCSTEQHGEAHTLNGTYATANRSYRMTKKERKRQISEALAAEAKTNELLARIPGRMSRNGSSSFICMFTQQGRKGTNQDAMVAWEGYVAEKGTVFCGVFDGHGPYGHLVARRVRDSLPSKLASIWKAKMRGDIHVTRQEAGDLELLPNWEGSGEFNITENGSPTGKTKTNVQQMHGKGDENEARDTYEMWSESFAEAFEAMDTDLRMHPTIDCFCSGTTSVTVIKQGEDLVIGNVGDSRAVLATLSHDSTLEAIQLTVDLKPSVPKEAERILKCNGRVFALEDEPEVARVWLPFDDAPGLAMARAFGDFCLKDFGLISEPEVTHHKLSPNDQFVVLATDGVWDVLSNKEVVEVVSSAPTRATAARSLVETAVRAWRLKYPNSKVDDCAVVCLYLHPPKPRTGKWSFSRDPGPSEGEQKSTNGGESGKEIAQCEAYEGRTEDFKCAEDGSLGRSNTVRNASDPEILNDAEKERREDMDGGKASIPDGERPPLSKSIGDCLTADDDDEWSALEGVVRVNSLLTLPRFVKGDKRGGPSKPT